MSHATDVPGTSHSSGTSHTSDTSDEPTPYGVADHTTATSLAPAVTIRPATPADLAPAQACLARSGNHGIVAPGDHTLVAAAAHAVVGVVRLAHEHGHRVLRGLAVDHAHRGQRLGHRLIHALLAGHTDHPIWLVCPTTLAPYYAPLGFAAPEPSAAPTFLTQRARGYEAEFGSQTVLCRAPDPTG